MLRIQSNRRRFCVLATTTATSSSTSASAAAVLSNSTSKFSSSTNTTATTTLKNTTTTMTNRKNNNVAVISPPSLFISKRNQVAPTVNMSDKPFQCSVCGKQFRLEGTGKVHLQTIHNGQGSIIASSSSGGSGGGAAGASSASASTSPSSPSSTAPPTSPSRNFPTQQVNRAAAFPTMGKGASMNPMGRGSDGNDREDTFRREIKRRDKAIGDVIYDKDTYDTIPPEAMKELMEVWDKFGVQRLGSKFVQFATAKQIYAAQKQDEDPTIPHYWNIHEEDEKIANPFESNDNSNGEQDSAKIVDSPESAAEAVADASSAAPTLNIGFALATVYKSPFICGKIENPLIAYPPPSKPLVRRKIGDDSNANNNNSSSAVNQEEDDDFYSNSSNNSAASSGEEDEGSSTTMQQQNKNDENETSAFAQVMQATSPFSVTESSAPLESAGFAPSSSSSSSSTVSSPFAQAAASSASPFASFDPNNQTQSPFGNQMAQTQQQAPPPQQQQQQQQMPASPFADLMQQQQGGNQQQQQQSNATTTTPYVAPSSGAPLTPIENAVDLSALFGSVPLPGQSSSQDGSSSSSQEPETWMCKICGKNTFKTEANMISHAKEKHGVIVAPVGAEGKGLKSGGVKKKVRQLPDLPPYIPTPIDLSATAPYGATRQRAASTAFWSEVEVSPHARMMSSMALLGVVENIIWKKSGENNEPQQEGGDGVVPTVLGLPCLQFTLHIPPSSNNNNNNEDEERITIRCFGDDIISLLAPSSSSSSTEIDDGKLKEGCSVYLEGILRLNPSYDTRLNRYQANPAVHVSLPNGFVQRLD